ncbi:MAG: hypothetical protein KGD66_03490 [Candidatus Lokiarchaeota archaeon]|nr:hypothetical protein [Candidatus Lokiarchaeota archaeon]
MTEQENKPNTDTDSSGDQERESKRSRSRRPVRKSQGQIIQEALGMKQEDISDVEEKLFIARFLDYFSEETLDFIFKEKSVAKYLEKLTTKIENLGTKEEDKLLKIKFEEREIDNLVHQVKARAEETAIQKGFNTSADKRLRKSSLMVTIPLLVVITVLAFIPAIDYTFMFPILCVFCMLPQFLKGSVLRKWTKFKEENRNDIYTENRDDIAVLKSYVQEVLSNIRDKLLGLKVPLQLIKFVLHSADYENLELVNQKTLKGLTQYYYTFAYPPGMDPIPIPENLQQLSSPISTKKKKHEKAEQNFIVLTDIKAKEGVIEEFTPRLRKEISNQINEMLNESDFASAPIDFAKIIPAYGKDVNIYCECGEVAEIINVQICTWKNEFQYYLFESARCNCGDKVYVLSLTDDISSSVPEELRDIFSS